MTGRVYRLSEQKTHRKSISHLTSFQRARFVGGGLVRGGWKEETYGNESYGNINKPRNQIMFDLPCWWGERKNIDNGEGKFQHMFFAVLCKSAFDGMYLNWSRCFFFVLRRSVNGKWSFTASLSITATTTTFQFYIFLSHLPRTNSGSGTSRQTPKHKRRKKRQPWVGAAGRGNGKKSIIKIFAPHCHIYDKYF